MKTIQCAHPPHHHNGFVATCRLWTASGMNSACTMHELRHWPSIAGMLPQSHCGDEEDGCIVCHVCHEPIFVLINVFMLLA